jgi:hypothetical protein
MNHSTRPMFRNCKLAAALSLLACSNPAWSQAAGSGSDSEAKPPKLVVELEAITKSVEDLRGKASDSVATGGGNLEGAILSSYAISAAANLMKDQAAFKAPGDYLIAGSEEAIGTEAYVLFQLEYDRLLKRAKEVGARGGGGKVWNNEKSFTGFAAGTTALLGLFSSLLRSETEVSELSGGLADDRLLAQALARAIGSKAVVLVPATSRSIGKDDSTIVELASLIDQRNSLARMLNVAKPNPAVKAVVDAIDTFTTALYTPDNAGKIKLLSVISARRLAEAIEGRTLVRVNIEKSNGTLLKRKSLWVALGQPSVLASGGLIATYVVDDGSGVGTATGAVVCATNIKTLRSIHKLDATGTKCMTN